MVMLGTSKTTTGSPSTERCDIKTWSGGCGHDSYTAIGEKFRCDLCGTIADLNHEVKHDTFPYTSGDYDNLS
jgi:hypothetical protein